MVTFTKPRDESHYERGRSEGRHHVQSGRCGVAALARMRNCRAGGGREPFTASKANSQDSAFDFSQLCAARTPLLDLAHDIVRQRAETRQVRLAGQVLEHVVRPILRAKPHALQYARVEIRVQPADGTFALPVAEANEIEDSVFCGVGLVEIRLRHGGKVSQVRLVEH